MKLYPKLYLPNVPSFELPHVYMMETHDPRPPPGGGAGPGARGLVPGAWALRLHLPGPPAELSGGGGGRGFRFMF